MTLTTRDDALALVTSILTSDLGVAPARITPEAHLFEDLGLDSLDLLTTIATIEEQLGITVLDEEVGHMVVVGRAADVLWDKVGR